MTAGSIRNEWVPIGGNLSNICWTELGSTATLSVRTVWCLTNWEHHAWVILGNNAFLTCQWTTNSLHNLVMMIHLQLMRRYPLSGNLTNILRIPFLCSLMETSDVEWLRRIMKVIWRRVHCNIEKPTNAQAALRWWWISPAYLFHNLWSNSLNNCAYFCWNSIEKRRWTQNWHRGCVGSITSWSLGMIHALGLWAFSKPVRASMFFRGPVWLCRYTWLFSPIRTTVILESLTIVPNLQTG